MDKEFYQRNRVAVVQGMQNPGMIILFGSSAPYKNAKGYYGKTLDMNFFYMTGLKVSSSIVAMWQSHGVHHEKLFIEKPNPDEEKWSGVKMTSPEATDISAIEDVDYLSSFDSFLSDMLAGSEISTLFLDIPQRHVDDVPAPIEFFIGKIRAAHPNIDIDGVSDVLAEMRTVKKPEEISCIRRAVANAKAGIELMLSSVHPGMHEYQLQAACYNLLYDSGEMKAAPMVAAAKNATILHYPEANAVIQEDDLVLIDFCPRYNYYASDISRAFPASGRFSERQKVLYNIALDANKKMIEVVKPGMSFQKMNELCRDYLSEGMLSIGLIQSRSEVETYYYHSVSHYMGLGIHDVGNTDLPLPVNAVLTIDAGIYVAEEGIGLRVEDDVLITSNGCENLSQSIMKEVDEIEAYMALSKNS